MTIIYSFIEDEGMDKSIGVESDDKGGKKKRKVNVRERRGRGVEL